MPLLENIRPSIRELSREDAMALVLSIRASRHTVKAATVKRIASTTTRKKAASAPTDPLLGMTKDQRLELLKMLDPNFNQGGGGEQHV